MSLVVGSIWRIERQDVPPEEIEITKADSIRFEAKYKSIPNDSEFTGEVWARERQVINIRQYQQSTNYVSFHTGLLKTNAATKQEYYEGSWYDVWGHDGGRFTLKPA
jgi:hypothetical protein